MKFAVLSYYLPPSPSGQAMVLYRHLRNLDPNSYCLISQVNYSPEAYPEAYSERMPGKYCRFQFAPETGGRVPTESRFRLVRFLKGFQFFRSLVRLFYILRRAREITAFVKREKCDAIVACTDTFYDLPAGALASRLTGTKLYAYIFDDYYYKWLDPEVLRLAQRLEPLALKRADGIIAPNEFMQDELRSRHDVEATIIRNACDVTECEEPPDVGAGEGHGGIRIVYTGAVYEAHYDAFVNLVEALKLLGRADVKLHIYTDQPTSLLEEVGISGPVVFHVHDPLSMMPEVQRGADLLFLSLAFNSPYPEVIKTSSPGKMSEYLAACRPILVHAPSDSFLAWYFRRHECGIVVDRLDPVELARAVERALGDEELRQRLSRNAFERAKFDFCAAQAQAAFIWLLRGQTPPRQT